MSLLLRRTALAAACACLALAAGPPEGLRADEPVTVTATLAPPVFRLGDVATLTVTVAFPRGATVDLPDLADDLAPLEVVQLRGRSTTRQIDGSQTLTLDYAVSGYLPGPVTVRPLRASYTLADGSRGTVAAASGFNAEVQSVLGEGNEPFRDIKPPLAIERAAPETWRTAAVAVAVLALVALVALAGRRLVRPRRPALVPVALSAEDEARAALAPLAEAALTSGGAYVAYYAAVSHAVRRYLDRRYELTATTSTSRELRKGMEARGLHPWQARVVSDLLDECDTAKWAHYRPDLPRARRALTIALEIVDLAGAGHSETAGPVGGGTARRDIL